MNRKALILSLVIIVSIFGGITFLFVSNNQNNPKQNVTPIPAATEPASQPTETGDFIDYTEETYLATTGTRLLFFYAPWCPQCRDLEADIQTDGVPDGVTIFKVDYDSNQALRQQYGVTIQTTLVKVDDQGELVEKYVAYDSPTLDAVKANLL